MLDAGTLNFLAGVGAIVGGGYVVLRDNRHQTTKHLQTFADSIVEGIKKAYQTNQEINQDTIATLKESVSVLKGEMQIVKQQAMDNKELADASIANRDKVQQQISEILQARERTAQEHKAELNALKADLASAKYEIQELTDQLSQERIKNTDLATTQAALLAAKTTIEDFGIKYRAVMDERDSLKNELSALRARVEKLEAELKQGMATIADQEKVIADQRLVIQQSALEKAALEEKVRQLQAELDRLSALLAQQSTSPLPTAQPDTEAAK